MSLICETCGHDVESKFPDQSGPDHFHKWRNPGEIIADLRAKLAEVTAERDEARKALEAK